MPPEGFLALPPGRGLMRVQERRGSAFVSVCPTVVALCMLVSPLLLRAQGFVFVKDALGRGVRVPEKVQRVVAIGPGALRLVVFLEATERVVGVEHGERRWSPVGRPYRVAHPELAELPIIGLAGPSPTPNPEAIIEVDPEVIFATYTSRKEADELQRRTGRAVIVLSYGPLGRFYGEEIFQSLRIAGEVLDKQGRAEELIAFLRAAMQDLKGRVRGVPEASKPTVYVGALGFKGGYGIESTQCDFPPFTAIEARNVLGNCQGHRFVDKEFLLKVDPDVIFLDLGNLHLVKEDYRRHRAFYRSLKAFREGRLYGILPFNWYATNLETSLADTYFIGKVLYPDRFRDVDPEEKAREIFRFFVGRDVYEEMKAAYGGFGRIDPSRW